jgi:hypothetical protein
MGKMQNAAATSSPIIGFHFSEADLAASQTDTAIPILGGDVNEYVAAKDGYIVGYAIGLSAAVTAGSLAVDLTINGTSTLTIDTDAASTTEFYSALDVPDEPFNAGDAIGATYTSDGSYSGATTDDIVVTIYVMYEDFTV